MRVRARKGQVNLLTQHGFDQPIRGYKRAQSEWREASAAAIVTAGNQEEKENVFCAGSDVVPQGRQDQHR